MIAAASPDRWGTLPDIAAAVGTVGTLALTYVLLRRAAQQRDQEQAESVAVWVDLVRHTPQAGSQKTMWAGIRFPTLFVRNASNSAVYATVVDVRCGGVSTATVDVGVTAPGATVERILENADIGRADDKGYGLNPDDFKALAVTAGVRFTDSGGRRWERDSAGHLRRVNPEQLRRFLRGSGRPDG